MKDISGQWSVVSGPRRVELFDPMKILIIVRTLGYGGAERQAVVLAGELVRRNHDVSLMPFYGGGELQQDLRSLRVRLISLEKRSRWDVTRVLWKLSRAVARERFDAIYTLGLGPNLAATFVRFFFPKTILFWSVRRTYVEALEHEIPSDFGWLSPKIARFADRIVFNSESGLDHGVACGYPRSKVICIPNGIDTEAFHPDPAEGRTLREEWGVAAGEKLIGVVGRIDPAKNHEDFLRAAALVARERADARFACVGEGGTAPRVRLQELARQLGIDNKVLWIEPRREMRAAYNAMDLLCSASLSEGFPNVIGEALACACPCVVTDVGDCRFLVADTGRVVPPGNPRALTRGILAELSSGKGRNHRGRQRVVEHFDVTLLGNRFEEALALEIAQPVSADQCAAWAERKQGMECSNLQERR